MEKVVVTGGAGFIGSNLAERLVTLGYYVVVVDDLSTGKAGNISGLVGKDNFQFVRGSILDLPVLQDVFRGVTYVFHQAALPRVQRSIDHPLTTNEVNVTGTLNVLVAARDNRVRKLVFASSSSVYGGARVNPQTEDLPPNPLSPYAITKITGEYYCNVFRNLYGLPTVCLRYFNVFGPRQDPTSEYATVIPAFVSRILLGKPPIIHGDGEQTRDTTFVQDVVQANVLAVESNAEGVYNIGSGRSTSVNKLAETVLSLMQKNLAPVYEKPRQGDPRFTLADITRARNFGYEPQWTLEAGLRETIGDFAAVLGGRKKEAEA